MIKNAMTHFWSQVDLLHEIKNWYLWTSLRYAFPYLDLRLELYHDLFVFHEIGTNEIAL